MSRPAPELLAAAEARGPILYAVALVALRGDTAGADRLTTQVLTGLLAGEAGPDGQPGHHTREELVRRLLAHAPGATGTTPEGPGASGVESDGMGFESDGMGFESDGMGFEWDGTHSDQALFAAIGDALADTRLEDRVALALVEFDDLTPARAEALVESALVRHTGAWRPQARTRPSAAAVCVDSAQDALTRRLAVLPHAPSASLSLHRWVAHFPDRPTSVAEVEQRRHRRGWTGLAAAGGLAAVSAVALALWWPTGTEPAATPSASTTLGQDRPAMFAIDGARFVVGVPVADEAALPSLPGADADVALPARLALPAGPITALTTGVLGDRSVRAVLVRRLPDGTGRVVLYVPRGDPEFVEVPDVVVPPRGSGVEAVNPRTISDDRRRLVVAEADAIAVVDTRTAAITRIPFVRQPGQAVGWAQGSQWAVVDGLDQPARIDPTTGEIQHMGPPGGFGRYEFVHTSTVDRLAFDFRGTLTEQRLVPGPLTGLLGSTVNSLGGWSGTGAVFAPNLVPERATHGVYAVVLDLSPAAYALVARPGEDRGVGGECCVALGWAPKDRLLYLAPAPHALRVLAWDVESGRQFRVSELPAPDVTGAWLGEFALSP